METLAVLTRRVEAAQELEAVTRMMKGMAAVGLRHFEEGRRTLDEYERVVEAGLQIALRGRRGRDVGRSRHGDGAALGLVVFGSNVGLCGPVNREVAASIERSIERNRITSVVAIGDRLADELELAGIGPVEAVIDLPSTIEGISARVDDVLLWIDEHVGRAVGRVELVVPELLDRQSIAPRSVVPRSVVPRSVVVVPTDPDRVRQIAARPWPTNHIPMHRGSWPRLVTTLTRELLLVQLHQAFVQTMAAVASSRLAAMDAAQRSVAERLDELHARHRMLRQSEITEELLDVVAGFETLTAPDRHGAGQEASTSATTSSAGVPRLQSSIAVQKLP